MKRVPLLLLAILAPSCGGTSTILFRGETVRRGSFGVVAERDQDRIIAADLELGIGLKLPYAEDWECEPTDQKPIFGRSASLLLFVTVQSHDPGRQVEEEAFLRDEFLKNIREGNFRRNTPIVNAEIKKHGSHFVLEYTAWGRLANGTIFRQEHFWTFRQRPDGLIWEAHLSTNHPDEARRAEVCDKIRKILGSEFKVLPVNPK